MTRAISLYIGMIQIIIGVWLLQTGQWIPFMFFVALGLSTGFFQRIYGGSQNGTA